MPPSPLHAKRMTDLADLIETNDRFDYAAWYRDEHDTNEAGEAGPAILLARCDTFGCVGGWAVAQAIAEGIYDADDFTIGVAGATTTKYQRLVVEIEAAHYLGLDPAEAESLFIGHAMAGAGWHTDNQEALMHGTALEAAKMLRGVVSGEYDLRELRDISYEGYNCHCDGCTAAREGGEA